MATIPERKNFIHSLQLPHAELIAGAPAVARIAPNTDAAFVMPASVTSFVAGISDAARTDVLNSTLLAQLASDKQNDRQKDPVAWYNFYSKVLENVGWVAQGFSFDQYQTGGSNLTIDQAVLQIVAAIVTQNELAIIRAALDALKSLSDNSKPLQIFDFAKKSVDTGAFQIVSATQSNDSVAMKVAAFHFKATQKKTRILWVTFSSSGATLFRSTQTISMNASVYSQVRAAVASKLGALAQAFVADLQI